MWPVKPQMDVWSEKPAMKSSNKKSIGLNKNCKDTICEYIDSKSEVSRNSDKNCQENENNVMGSVTKEIDVWLPKPAVPYE